MALLFLAVFHYNLFLNSFFPLLFYNYLFNNYFFFFNLDWLFLNFRLLNLNGFFRLGDLNLFDFWNDYFLIWFYLGNINIINFSFHINLHILLSLKHCLHNLDVLVAEDGDLVIILIEEGELKGGGFDIELLFSKGSNVIILESGRVEPNHLIEF